MGSMGSGAENTAMRGNWLLTSLHLTQLSADSPPWFPSVTTNCSDSKQHPADPQLRAEAVHTWRACHATMHQVFKLVLVLDLQPQCVHQHLVPWMSHIS